MMEGFTPDRTFETGEGVVIDLTTIVSGGKVRVLRDLQQKCDDLEEVVGRLDDELDETRQALDALELDLARTIAQRDAYRLALKSAKSVLAP